MILLGLAELRQDQERFAIVCDPEAELLGIGKAKAIPGIAFAPRLGISSFAFEEFLESLVQVPQGLLQAVMGNLGEEGIGFLQGCEFFRLLI
jgi:hypothetical protein